MLEVKIKKKLPGFTLDVSFSVNQEILAILGPSGSGKTMTLQCIAGLLCPDEGYVKLNDKILLDSAKRINRPAQTRKVGFVFQNYALFPHLTVTQNVLYGIHHIPIKDAKIKVAELLEKMNIGKLADRYPRQLSAGQQQRVAVARALAPEPEVLLLDEPFSALDSMVKERLQLELQSLQQFYKGNILFVTHDLAEGYKLSSSMAVFESGRIVQHDEKTRVVSYPANHVVARLVGFKNLMEGTVIEATDSRILVEVPELGGNLRTSVPPDTQLSFGQKVTVGIRPEYIQLTATPGENTFTGVVDRVAEGVTSTNYYFHIDAVGATRHYIMVILPSHFSSVVNEGKSNYLYFPPERIVIITD